MHTIAGAGGVDTALEFVGRPETLESAVRCLDAGGVAVAVGLGQGKAQASHLMTLVVRERSIVGAYGNEPEEVATVLDMMASGTLALPKVVGDVIPMTDVVSGLERVARGDTGGSRIVLDIEKWVSRERDPRPHRQRAL